MLRMMLCCLAMAALIAGCGEDSDSSSGSRTTARTTQTTASPAFIENPFEKPTRGPGAHPNANVERLIVKDVVVGDGEEIQAGDTGYFEFILADWESGKLIDSSWGKATPFSIQVEKNVSIDGWWQGIPGMRVGGRRTLVIPPSLGFVNNPNPKVDEKTTYFDIVLQGIVRSDAPPPGGVPGEPEGEGAGGVPIG
jgi:FKBP-type peptidyl-prolyl cis-trans isomerase